MHRRIKKAGALRRRDTEDHAPERRAGFEDGIARLRGHREACLPASRSVMEIVFVSPDGLVLRATESDSLTNWVWWNSSPILLRSVATSLIFRVRTTIVTDQ